MDILAILTEQTAPIALAIVVMYFYNKMVEDVLKERKEMVESIRAERKEWNERSSNLLEQVLLLVRSSTEAMTELKIRIHNLNNEITKITLASYKDSQSSSSKESPTQ